MKKTPLFYISPALLVSVALIGIVYAALYSFLYKEWGRGRHDWSDELPEQAGQADEAGIADATTQTGAVEQTA